MSGDTGDSPRRPRQPHGGWLMAVTLAAGAAAFASRVMPWNTTERLSFMVLMLVAIWVLAGIARIRYPSDPEAGRFSASVGALLGASMVGIVLGLLAGDVYREAWPDRQTLFMNLVGLGLGLFWLQPWFRRR